MHRLRIFQLVPQQRLSVNGKPHLGRRNSLSQYHMQQAAEQIAEQVAEQIAEQVAEQAAEQETEQAAKPAAEQLP
jgi:hypothetical protein